MNLGYWLFVWVLWNAETVLRATGDEGLAYPEDTDVNRFSDNLVNRKPVQLPTKCRIGELYYPDDKGDAFECDCKPGHIYHAASDRCFLAYTRGPCAPNQYLILPLDSKSATCVPNVCRNDNVVLFRGACYRLHTAGPCPIPEINNVISVNPFTLELECSKSNLLSSTDDNQETNFCRRGGLLWFNGKCGNNENNTKPELPGCPPGELYFPGDQPDEWRCDCKPGYIYHSTSDSCFAAYKRGPCATGQYFLFPVGVLNPICVRNRCPNENEAFFLGACYRLNTVGPCSMPGFNVFGVNSMTLQLQCLASEISLSDRVGDLPKDKYPEKACFIGSRRSLQGKCGDR